MRSETDTRRRSHPHSSSACRTGVRQRCTCDTRPRAEQSTQQQPPMSHTCSSSGGSGSGLPTTATSSICAQAAHTHTRAQMVFTSQHHLTGPRPSAPPPPQHGRGGRPDREDSSRENPVLYPISPPPTFSPYSLQRPREAWGRGWRQRHWSPTRPSTAEIQAGSAQRVRGMGCACSLTQPALGTTAQLDRAATCRWAGESNERES